MAELEKFGDLVTKNWGKIWLSVGIVGGIAVMKYGPRMTDLIGKKIGKEVSERLQNSNYQSSEIKNLYSIVNDLSQKLDEVYKRIVKNE